MNKKGMGLPEFILGFAGIAFLFYLIFGGFLGLAFGLSGNTPWIGGIILVVFALFWLTRKQK